MWNAMFFFTNYATVSLDFTVMTEIIVLMLLFTYVYYQKVKEFEDKINKFIALILSSLVEQIKGTKKTNLKNNDRLTYSI